MKRSIITIFALACYLIFALLWQLPDNHVHLVFCDVGQGDAILMTDGYTQMLVDGGRSSAVMDCLAEHMPFWDRTLEFVVATHPDADHVSGLVPVMQNYRVLTLLTTSLGKETADFESFKSALDQEAEDQAKIMRPQFQQHITLTPRIQATVLTPGEKQTATQGASLALPETRLSDKNAVQSDTAAQVNDYNNWSIALFVTLDQVKVLLTGDLETAGEEALVDAQLTQDVDILKVGHHGSKSSTSKSFLEETAPEISVISVGKNNRYRHPSSDVLQRLEHQGSRVLRTDQQGTLEFLIDGGSYSLVDRQKVGLNFSYFFPAHNR